MNTLFLIIIISFFVIGISIEVLRRSLKKNQPDKVPTDMFYADEMQQDIYR